MSNDSAEPMRSLQSTPGDNLVVFDDGRRIVWDGGPSTWRYKGQWPTRRQANDLLRRLKAGAGLLVVTPAVNDSVIALGSELGGDQDLVEVEVVAHDWLPMRLRRVANRHRRRVRAAVLSSTGRVAVSHETSRIRFAVHDGRQVPEARFIELADRLFCASINRFDPWRKSDDLAITSTRRR